MEKDLKDEELEANLEAFMIRKGKVNNDLWKSTLENAKNSKTEKNMN